MKATRDAVASLLLVDDRDARVQWRYEQEECDRIGIRIVMEKT